MDNSENKIHALKARATNFFHQNERGFIIFGFFILLFLVLLISGMISVCLTSQTKDKKKTDKSDKKNKEEEEEETKEDERERETDNRYTYLIEEQDRNTINIEYKGDNQSDIKRDYMFENQKDDKKRDYKLDGKLDDKKRDYMFDVKQGDKERDYKFEIGKNNLHKMRSGNLDDDEVVDLMPPDEELDYDLKRADEYLRLADNHYDLEIPHLKQDTIASFSSKKAEVPKVVKVINEKDLIMNMGTHIGLENNGPVSYANATLQCLINIPQFINIVVNDNFYGTKIPKELYDFIYKYKVDLDSKASESLINSMQIISKKFPEDRESEPELFFTELMNMVTSESNRKKEYEALWKGLSKTKLSCAQCDYFFEEVYVLPPLKVNIDSYEKDKMFNLFQEPQLRNECPKCEEETFHINSTTIDNPPEILMLKLERDQDDHHNIVASPILNDLTFKIVDGLYGRYDFLAGVLYTGENTFEYIGVVKDENDPKLNWVYCDENPPKKKRLNEITNCIPRILFYKKKNRAQQLIMRILPENIKFSLILILWCFASIFFQHNQFLMI